MDKGVKRSGTISTKLLLILIVAIVLILLIVGAFAYISFKDFVSAEVLVEVNRVIPRILATVIVTCIVIIILSYIFIRNTISKPLRDIAEKSQLLVLSDTELAI